MLRTLTRKIRRVTDYAWDMIGALTYGGVPDDYVEVSMEEQAAAARQHEQDQLERISELTENFAGILRVPVGAARNFVINGRHETICIATFEPTVVAAASKGAKCTLNSGGFAVSSSGPSIIGQIAYSRLADPVATLALLKANAESLDEQAGALLPPDCTKRSLRLQDIRFVPIVRSDENRSADTMIVVELLLDPDEAMGAGMVTRLCQRFADEALRPLVGADPVAAICSNARAGRLVRANAQFIVPGGREQRDRISDLHKWAEDDRARAATHNKGIMNAVSGIALAAGQDTQAVEQAAAAMAAQLPRGYGPLTTFVPLGNDMIDATLELYVPVGSVGAGPRHPDALRFRRDMRAQRLAQNMAAAGLAQCFAALLCLTGEGIPEANRRVAAARLG